MLDPAVRARNGLQPRWEDLHQDPLFRDVNLTRSGVWKESGEMLGLAHGEHRQEGAYRQPDSPHPEPKREMARDMGVAPKDPFTTPTSIPTLSKPLPTLHVPAGVRLTRLAEENEWRKVECALRRGGIVWESSCETAWKNGFSYGPPFTSVMNLASLARRRMGVCFPRRGSGRFPSLSSATTSRLPRIYPAGGKNLERRPS